MSQTCTHIHDIGGACKSFAVKGQRYCVHHLRYRARRLHMAQARARGERFQFNLPPLESMHAVHSALSQLAEAIAVGVIDHRYAHLLLSVLRVASSNLRHPEKWQPSLYQSDQPAPDIDIAAEYGLPADLDLDTPPEVAFPQFLCGPQLPDVGHRGNANAGVAAAPFSPSVGESLGPADPTAPADPFHRLNFMERVTPFDLELKEIQLSQGADAMNRRIDQFEKEELRRKRGAETRAAHQRFSELAFHRNVEILAQKIAKEKLAQRHPDQEPDQSAASKPPVFATPKPPTSVAALPSTDSPIGQKSDLTPTG